MKVEALGICPHLDPSGKSKRVLGAFTVERGILVACPKSVLNAVTDDPKMADFAR
jgi:hypothetical protein